MGANSIDDDYWVMGNHFMRKYYTIFDYELAKLGFVEAKGYSGHQPQESDNVSRFLILFIIAFVIVLFILAITIKIYRIHKNKKQKLESFIIITDPSS